MIGPIINTTNANKRNSNTNKYMVQSTPNTNHQRCGALSRHVDADPYSRICAIRNQTRVKNDRETVNLRSGFHDVF